MKTYIFSSFPVSLGMRSVVKMSGFITIFYKFLHKNIYIYKVFFINKYITCIYIYIKYYK